MPQPAVPVDPITGILNAFQAHSLVAVSEGTNHGDEQGHAFLRSLISDPRFAATVDDIVVEFGNSLYQDVMDRFMCGEDVPDKELERVWQNTTQPFATFDLPVYEQFFRAVRAVNTSLTKENQLRVLLGDPPFDWDRVHSKDDCYREWERVGDRDRHAADLIRREVLAKQRRALLIYGGMHLCRREIFFNYEATPVEFRALVGQLESTPAVKVFTIWMAEDLEKLQSDIGAWRVRSMAFMRGTVLGAADFTFYYPHEVVRHGLEDGKPVSIGEEEWHSLKMEDQFDAVIYAGCSLDITFSELSPSKCADASYVDMRATRLALAQLSQDAIDDFRRSCDARSRPTKAYTGITVREFLDGLRRSS